MSYRHLVPGLSVQRRTGPVYATEKSVVQLKIPLEWNLWRIYQVKDWTDRREAGDLDVYPKFLWRGNDHKEWFVRWRDPMDEDGFDDATSFPALKPDLDIFGPPGPYRKQRGWYHVRRWPLVTHSTAGVGQAQYATGADIPPEVIDMIADYLTHYELDEKHLRMLRLVCGRWQDHFVGQQFHSISAASSQRIRELSALQTKRLALGWKAYPIRRSEFELNLDQPSKMQSWVEAVMRLELNEDARLELTIYGPVATGRQFTSVYLSSPCRALWNPIPIENLELSDVHFKKPSDLVRLLRELPFLEIVKGGRVTWDTSSDQGPRMMSFIPAKLPSDGFPHYLFTDSQRGIAGILDCALTPAGQSPIAQSDAEALSRLSADLDVSESGQSENPMYMEWNSGPYDHRFVSATVDIWLERMDTRPQVRVVKCLIFNAFDEEVIQHILSMPWEAVAAHIEILSTQPKVLFLLRSTTSATLFSEHFAAVPKMASLRATNRLIYVLEDRDKQLLSVVKEGEDVEWITLAHAKHCPSHYYDFETYDDVLDELVTWTIGP